MLRTLRGGTVATSNERPHEVPLHGRAKATFRMVYYTIEFALGTWLKYRWIAASGTNVLVERGWEDMLVDPKRYMFADTRLLRFLSPLVRPPDITFILELAGELAYARKAELTPAESDRQTALWRTTARSRIATVTLDASLPLESLTQAIVLHLESARRPRTCVS